MKTELAIKRELKRVEKEIENVRTLGVNKDSVYERLMAVERSLHWALGDWPG